jgi:methionyl-tRNA formyltransferase
MSAFRTVFMGTPDICSEVLAELNKNPKIDLVQVISMPDRPAGRGHKLKSPEVIDFARDNNIAFYQTDNINRDLKTLQNLGEIDLIIVFAFAQFLNDQILNYPKLGCFNIHTSLLPKYRGAAPIQYAILNGDSITGVSIQRMVKKMDAGDIAQLLEIKIEDNETSESLYNKLKSLSATCLNQLVENLPLSESDFIVQDESQVSFAPTIKKSQGHIIFEKVSYTQIDRKLRAFTPWPGIFCFINGKRAKILEVEESLFSIEPGVIKIQDNSICVGCLNGAIRLKKLHIEGKKPAMDTELINGYQNGIELTEAK